MCRCIVERMGYEISQLAKLTNGLTTFYNLNDFCNFSKTEVQDSMKMMRMHTLYKILFIYIKIYVYVCVCVCVCIYTHTHTHTHTHTIYAFVGLDKKLVSNEHTHIHIHTHTHTNSTIFQEHITYSFTTRNTRRPLR